MTGYTARTCKGCGEEVPAQQMGQPRKWCSTKCRSETCNRSRRKGRKPLSQRLQSKLQEVDACLVFTGHRNEHGYGVIRGGNGKTCLAHRAAWMVEHGEIPDGMQVLHRCDNPPCCNPAHLWIGTHEDNMRDRDEKGRTLSGDDLRAARWGR